MCSLSLHCYGHCSRSSSSNTCCCSWFIDARNSILSRQIERCYLNCVWRKTNYRWTHTITAQSSVKIISIIAVFFGQLFYVFMWQLNIIKINTQQIQLTSTTYLFIINFCSVFGCFVWFWIWFDLTLLYILFNKNFMIAFTILLKKSKEKKQSHKKPQSVQNELLIRNCASSSETMLYKHMRAHGLTPISFFISLFFLSTKQTTPKKKPV